MQGYNLTMEQTPKGTDVKFNKNKKANILHFLLIAGVLVGVVLYADKKLDEVI